MRNKNINQKGSTDVKFDGRAFDSTKVGISDSNSNWYDFEPYYDEDQYKAKETVDAYDAVERGKAFVRGRQIMLALQEEAEKNIRAHKRELQTA